MRASRASTFTPTRRCVPGTTSGSNICADASCVRPVAQGALELTPDGKVLTARGRSVSNHQPADLPRCVRVARALPCGPIVEDTPHRAPTSSGSPNSASPAETTPAPLRAAEPFRLGRPFALGIRDRPGAAAHPRPRARCRHRGHRGRRPLSALRAPGGIRRPPDHRKRVPVCDAERWAPLANNVRRHRQRRVCRSPSIVVAPPWAPLISC